MSHVEEVLKLIALEMAHARLGREASRTGNNGDASHANLTRVITAKAHAPSLAAPTMLRVQLEYRYRSEEDEDFTPTPEESLPIDSALWADDSFIDRYARASLLASEARVTVITDPDGAYQACVVEVEQAGLGWIEV